ncbi:MAG: polynucleotide adenylyltransferase PcnB [Gammaproteobacteria bacterium]
MCHSLLLTGTREIKTPTLIKQTQHAIAHVKISENALRVVNRLNSAGYEAYLVGGCVRDLLLGRVPHDFDIATNARPEHVEQLFRNCRLIGRRFRLAHVRFGREIVEVATFRGSHSDENADGLSSEGRIVRDNVFGSTLEEDAWRRDFTVNALYYDIKDFSVVDYTGGVEHLKAGVLQLMGDPALRYREDPVRMLRAVRFAAKLGFRIHPDSEAPLVELGALLEDIPAARLFEEILKLFMGGDALVTFELLRHYQLFGHLFPQTEASLEKRPQAEVLMKQALANTDARIRDGKPVTPAFLFAALLWEPMHQMAEQLQTQEMGELQAMQIASEMVVVRQVKRTALPKRFSVPMREIWAMQPRLRQRSGKRALRLLTHPRFRAAYDFLLLRCSAGDDLQELCDWWTQFQGIESNEQEAMVKRIKPTETKPRRRRRKSPSSTGK